MHAHRIKALATVAGAATLVMAATLPAQAVDWNHHRNSVTKVVDLSGPRGVDSIVPGVTVVAEDNGDVSLVVERRHRDPWVKKLAGLPDSAGFANAISSVRGRLYVVTGGGEPGTGSATGAATLYKLHGHTFRPMADIAAYQATDPDPYNLEGPPEESNPYGVQALRDGTVLVADAANNDLLRVWPDGTVKTVATIKPRTVETPDGLPPTDPDGNPLPPAGTPIPAEAVATSVTVGADGYWYVGELRGFPATPGSSEIWRIRPGAINAVCDPEAPHRGACQRYADGFTSIVDLSSDRRGNIYAASLSKKSWLGVESGLPGSEVGALYKIYRGTHHVREIAKDQIILPGATDVALNGDIYLTGPVFGPGALSKIR